MRRHGARPGPQPGWLQLDRDGVGKRLRRLDFGMADPEATKLCTQIVRSHFGPLTAVGDSPTAAYPATLTWNAEQTVASALLTRGRLTLGQIARFTSLKPRTIRATVIALFQQNLLWRSSADEEKEVLEFNVDECLTRLRFGRYVWWAEKKCGPLVSLPILLGVPSD